MSKETVRDVNGLTEEEYLKQYTPGNYERPSVTVDMLLFGMDEHFDNLKILMIQRKNHPFINKWAFPGGFVDIDESAYHAACRELEEETGLKNVYMEQLYTFTDPERDPRMRVIDIAYISLLPTCPVNAGDDARDAAWFNVYLKDNELLLTNPERDITIRYSLVKRNFKNGVIDIFNYDKPVQETEEGLAFDHAQILVESIMRLRNKVQYTDIAFNLMPEEFTLTDLMRVHEIILDKEMYRKNFRDKMKQKTVAIGKIGYSKSTNGNTPSELYKYQPQKEDEE